MWRLGLIAVICGCSCQSSTPPNSGSRGVGSKDEPFVSSSRSATPEAAPTSSEESAVVTGAMEEFFASRWQEWNVGDLIALEPAWVNGQFDSVYFDKALDYWITKFGNDGNPSEDALRRVRETLVTAGSPPAIGNRVEKGLASLNLGTRVVLVPSTYFDNSAAFVPGAVQFKSPSGAIGGIRARGAVSYPMFSGDGHYAYLQMSHVKAGNDTGQLHFFMVKIEGKWKALAVGKMAE